MNITRLAPEKPSDDDRQRGWHAAAYHENTKIGGRDRQYNLRDIMAFQQRSVAGPRYVPSLDGDSDVLELPSFRCSLRTLDRVIRRRRTCRQYSGRACSIRQLARIMHNAYGVGRLRTCDLPESWVGGRTETPEPLNPKTFGRMIPSAGGFYPLQLFCLVLRVGGARRGVYHYDPWSHLLRPVAATLEEGQLMEASLHSSIVRTCSFVIVVASSPDAVMEKYGDRGYRYVLLEAGHLAQNVVLTVADMRLGATPLGGFLDDDVSALLSTRGIWSPVYLLAVGYPKWVCLGTIHALVSAKGSMYSETTAPRLSG